MVPFLVFFIYFRFNPAQIETNQELVMYKLVKDPRIYDSNTITIKKIVIDTGSVTTVYILK